MPWLQDCCDCDAPIDVDTEWGFCDYCRQYLCEACLSKFRAASAGAVMCDGCWDKELEGEEV